MRLLAVSFMLMVLLGACSEQPSDTNVSAELMPQALQIPWYEGSVEDAFAQAKAENKPLYFYWGAVWCPPCQEIKHTVFKSQQFINLSHLFVPVYLDGDTDRAQAYGEKFGVKGYPTMIVFNPSGEEVTRIPGGIDISRYNTILQLSLNQMTPTATLLMQARQDVSQLKPSDYTQLAYYSWFQDANAFPEDESPELFRKLSEGASALIKGMSTNEGDDARQLKESSARLFFQYLLATSQELKSQEKESQEKQSNDEQSKDKQTSQTDETSDVEVAAEKILPEGLANAATKIDELLASPAMVLACWDYLAYGQKAITNLLPVDDVEKRTLQDRWIQAVWKLRHDESLSTAESLGGWLPYLQVQFASEDADEFPSDKRDAFVSDMQAADKKTSNSFARLSVVNQMNYLYQQAQMVEEAEAMLVNEVEKSKTPYYFMSSLSSIAEKQDRKEDALEWRRKAWEASAGAATRLQWGASYIRTLIRLSPEDHALIVKTTQQLVEEGGDENELFSGRNFRVMRALNGKLNSWAEEQDTVELLSDIKEKVSSLCRLTQADSVEQSNCEELIAAPTV